MWTRRGRLLSSTAVRKPLALEKVRLDWSDSIRLPENVSWDTENKQDPFAVEQQRRVTHAIEQPWLEPVEDPGPTSPFQHESD